MRNQFRAGTLGVFAEFERSMMVESALGCCEGQGERHQERETLRSSPYSPRAGAANP